MTRTPVAPAVLRWERLRHDGEEIYVQVTVPRDVAAPRTVVFGHGAGGCHLSFFQQAAAFASTHRVVLWDQRGFGLSTARTGASGPLVAAGDLLAVLDWLDDPAPVHLVGQSMGGWAALHAALRAPERVSSVLLSGSVGGLFEDGTRASLDGFLEGMVAASDQPVVAGASAATARDLGARAPALAHLYQMIAGLRNPGVDAVRQIRAVETDLLEVARLPLPLLFVLGKHDQIFRPDDVQSVVDQLPNASLVEVAGVGHSPYFEAADVFNEILAGFLRSVEDLAVRSAP